MTVGIFTLGCRVNQYESEAIGEALNTHGIIVSDAGEPCDAYIINTCTVTAESSRKARQFIRRAIKENPDAFILVTGCYAQTEADAIAKIAGVDYICGSRNKLSTVDALLRLMKNGCKNKSPEINVTDVGTDSFEQMSISTFGRTRAYVKIEDGCENKCAYCIIPTARGKVCSKSEDEVIKEVTALVAGGYKEIVLTGIETAAYGKDLKNTDLITLLKKIDNIEGIERVRLGSLDPSFADERFAREAAEMKHLCHHFHLSLQSGCDSTLRAMRRRYNTTQAKRNIDALRRYLPDVCFSADIIVGFPNESEEDFIQTADFLREARLLHGHIFSFSKRAGTEAAVMSGQIPEEVKKERNRTLTELCDNSGNEIISSYVGKRMEVLFETFDGGYAYGHTDNFIEVKASATPDVCGNILPVEIFATDNKLAIAKLI